MQEALEFLESTENTRDPQGALKGLFVLYEEIDPYADYVRAGEREFFPEDKGHRTLERFLQGFKHIYYILKRAQERLYLTNAFDNFWEQCKAYLGKCRYSHKFISRACAKDSMFYRQSFNYWRQEFGDSEEGFSVMFEYFKACFGIEGNDEYCCIDRKRDIAYDWRRMKRSYEKFYKKPVYADPVLEPLDYVPPSQHTLEMLRERIRQYRMEQSEDTVGADALLHQIQRRNKEKGYFQHS